MTTPDTTHRISPHPWGNNAPSAAETAPDGTIWVLSRPDGYTYSRLWYSQDGGATFTQATGAPNGNSWSRMAIDQAGNVHLTETAGNGGLGQVRYQRGVRNAQGTDFTFDAEVQVGNSSVWPTAMHPRAIAALDPSPYGSDYVDVIAVACRQDNDYGYMLTWRVYKPTGAVTLVETDTTLIHSEGSYGTVDGVLKREPGANRVWGAFSGNGGVVVRFDWDSGTSSWNWTKVAVPTTGSSVGSQYCRAATGVWNPTTSRFHAYFGNSYQTPIGVWGATVSPSMAVTADHPTHEAMNTNYLGKQNLDAELGNGGDVHLFRGGYMSSATYDYGARLYTIKRTAGGTWDAAWSIWLDHPGLVYSGSENQWSVWASRSATRLDTFAHGSKDYENYHASLTLNSPPSSPSLVAPVGSAPIDRAATNRFSWSFADPDPGDSQSAFDLRYRPVGGSTWTEVYQATPSNYLDVSGGTFPAGDHEWQVRTYDAIGAVGPWSPSGFFLAADAPAQPTITAPTHGATIAQATAEVTWSAPAQQAYQLQVLDGGLVVHDSGVVSSTNRTAAVPLPDNNVSRDLRVRVRNDGLWSAWYTITVTVSYTKPPTPVVQLTANGTAIAVQVTNPAPAVGEPTVVANDLFVTEDGREERRAVLAPNGTWTYWLPKAGLQYDQLVRVEAIGDNETRSSS